MKKPKFCKYCKEPLFKVRERMFKTCKSCAGKARDSFKELGTGDVKKGFDDLLTMHFSKQGQKDIAKSQIKKVLNDKKYRDQVIRNARKKGISEEEIKESLAKYDTAIK